MLCLKILVNGKNVAVIAKEHSSNYHATVTHWGNSNNIELSANGAADLAGNITQTFNWGRQNLSSGDEITIKIIECDNPDEPLETEKHDHSEAIDEFDNKIVEMMAKMKLKMEIVGEEAVLNDTEYDEDASGQYCSFCGLGKTDVNILIKGPSVNICDNCVSQCNEDIEAKSGKNSAKWPKRDD